MLIEAIEQRPAFWNFKLSAQKRTPSIKRDLWDEIYNNLGNIKSFYFVLCIYEFITCGCIDDFVNTKSYMQPHMINSYMDSFSRNINRLYKLTSVKLAPHLLKNEIFIRVLNAPQRVPKFLPKIKNSSGELSKKIR